MERDEKFGILYTSSAFLIWGFLPIYWKQMEHISSGEILAYRIIWSFIFMIAVVFLTRNSNTFYLELRTLIKDRKKALSIIFASLFISLNWLLFIWAVNQEHVIQVSLGYYINPLISILLGIIVLKEKASKIQVISFTLAGIGVLYLTFSFGVFPWISLALAFSFAFYGLLKKTVQISSMFGLTIETFIVTPISLLYIFLLPNPSFSIGSEFISVTSLYLIGSGVVTAIPLLLFGSGTKSIPLAMVGLLQYIAPTIMLILGVFMYNETFTSAHLIAFIFIWTALFLYMGSHYKASLRQKQNKSYKIS